jgi:hypothetical protein
MRSDPRFREVRGHADDALAITNGVSLALGTMDRWLAAGRLPTPEMVDSLIDKASRLQTALKGCKVEVPERTEPTL